MELVYVFLIILGIAATGLGIYARKKIQKDVDQKTAKSKWQLIIGLVGVVFILIVGILIFTMF